MKKKVVAIALIITCFVSILSGCGQEKIANTKENFEKKYSIANYGEANKVIFDTDLFNMNDDTYALLELLQAHKLGYVDLLGITTTGGNVLQATATYETLRLLEKLEVYDIPVSVGSDVPLAGFKDINDEMGLIGKMDYIGGYSYLSEYTDDYEAVSNDILKIKPIDEKAIDFMIEQVHTNPGEVTIFATGGCTNVAQAILKDPTFANDAKGIVYMGGVFDVPGEELPNIEINWWYDPEATDICLQADWKEQLIVPHDAAVNCLKGKDVYELYKSNNTTAITNMIVDNLSPIYENGKEEELLYCWDPITVAIFLCPDLIVSEETRDVLVETTYGHAYGSSFSYTSGKGPKGSSSAKIVFKVDRDRFWKFVSDLYAIE